MVKRLPKGWSVIDGNKENGIPTPTNRVTLHFQNTTNIKPSPNCNTDNVDNRLHNHWLSQSPQITIRDEIKEIFDAVKKETDRIPWAPHKEVLIYFIQNDGIDIAHAQNTRGFHNKCIASFNTIGVSNNLLAVLDPRKDFDEQWTDETIAKNSADLALNRVIPPHIQDWLDYQSEFLRPEEHTVGAIAHDVWEGLKQNVMKPFR